MVSPLSDLITSKVRIRILMRLFLNPHQKAYLRELVNEFKVSSGQMREELKHLKDANILVSEKNGRTVLYSANTKHLLFAELQSMVKKSLGMDRILESIIKRLGDLESAYLLDDYAEGKDTGIIDLLLVGKIDQDNLQDLVRKTERYIERKIRILVLNSDEFEKLKKMLISRPKLLLWERN